MCNDPNCPKCSDAMVNRSQPHPWKDRHVAIGSADATLNRAIVKIGDWFDAKHGKNFSDFILTNDHINHLPNEEQVAITTYGIRVLMSRLPKSPQIIEGTVVYPEQLAGRRFYFHNAELLAPVDPTADDAVAMDFESITPEKLATYRDIFDGVTNDPRFRQEHHPLSCRQFGPAKVLDWMERFGAFVVGGMPEAHYRKYVDAMVDLTEKIERRDVGYPEDNDYVMVYFKDTDTIRAIHNSAIEVEMQLLA